MSQMQRKIKHYGVEYTVDFELDIRHEVFVQKVEPPASLTNSFIIKVKLQHLIDHEKKQSYNESVEHEAWLRVEHS